jgi:guanylate kinase
VKNKGLLFVISAPSGAGKTTLSQALINTTDNIEFSVSVTTRRPRGGEIDGRDYFFVSKKEFKEKIHRGELIEWANVHGHCYGTPKKFVETSLLKGKDIILDIDVQGGIQVKKLYPRTRLIFIIPPSVDVLEKRLRKRALNNETEITKRLHNAYKEMELMKEYDYVVVNDQVSTAVNRLKDIITTERIKNRGV